MKKSFVVTGLSLLALLTLVLYLVFSGLMLLYRSEKKIKEKLLARTPLGTSLEEVREYLKETDFEIEYDSPTGRYDLSQGIPQGTPLYSREADHSMRVYLGEYQGIPWMVGVVAFWVFKSDVLIEIVTWKDYDGL